MTRQSSHHLAEAPPEEENTANKMRLVVTTTETANAPSAEFYSRKKYPASFI